MRPLDTKAILEGRKPGRHSVGLIAGIVVSVLCMLLMLGYLLLSGLVGAGTAGVVAFLVSLVAAVVPVTILVPLILLLDRLEPEPNSVLLFAFLWGAGVAVLTSFVLNTLGMELYTVPVFGEDLGAYLSAAVGAPLVEESAKGLALLLLLWRRRHEIDSSTDGIIYAAMVATGFAFVENVSYFLGALFTEGAAGFAVTFVLRGIIAPLGHPLYTAMIGLGVAYAATHRGVGRLFMPVLGWLGAVVLHALWNGSTAFGWTGLGLVYALLFCVLVALIVVAVRDRRRQVAAIAHYLPQYIPTGLVTPHDIQMLSTMGGRKRARAWARQVAGARGRRAMEDYQLAATELALLHRRLDRGVARPDWWERRDAILALMHMAREAFLGRAVQPAAPTWTQQPTDSGFLRRSDFQHVIAQAHAQQGGMPPQPPATDWRAGP
ncbi:PrsW family intramembrane metalloprotease, partial [Thermobifida halotolerans]|uniref:PrsW family intramembrane metalloprotease n=1 Tax=Thermobifida halotolerans TaxID=483545 RepID=UPI0012F48653